jgi:hypothetical protein
MAQERAFFDERDAQFLRAKIHQLMRQQMAQCRVFNYLDATILIHENSRYRCQRFCWPAIN